MNRIASIGLNVLTHSAESCFKTCPRKFMLQYRQGIRPAHDSDALRLGSAFHVGIEVAKRGGDCIAAVAAVRDLYANATLPPWMTVDDFAVEEETAVALVSGWIRHWMPDLVIKYVAVELAFDLPLVNPKTGRTSRTFRNRGKIDAIAELADGRVALVEHKTAGVDISPASDYWRKLTMDAQVSRYVLAARELGYPVSTVAYDVVRKPSIKPKLVNKIRETAVEYADRLLADMLERPDFYFARVEVPRTESDLERFRSEQWMIAQQVAQADRLNLFYRNTNSCLSPYRCTYFDVCASGIDTTYETPAGFRREDVLHPELAITNGAETHE